MPDFLTIQRQHEEAKAKGLLPADSTLADFAKIGASATDDPSYQAIADSPAWKNMIRSWSANVDAAVQSGPVDDWTAEAYGKVGDLLGVDPEVSRAAGRELPRQVLNFVPMLVGGAIGGLAGGPPGAAVGGKIGLGLTSGLSAFDAYGKSGEVSDAAIGAVAPYLGGKLSEFGSKAALKSAATPGSFLNKLGFMAGKDVTNPATHVVKDAATGVAKKVLGETVDTFKDKALGYAAGEALANVGFAGLDILQQGPDAVLNKDYLFANLASNVPFMVADLPNFTKTRFAWEPVDAPLVPTQAQINAEKTRGEKVKESLGAIDNTLKKFQAEMDLGVDVGKFVNKYNSVAATMEAHRAVINLETKNFQNTWNELRTVNAALPEIPLGVEPQTLLKNPSVIGFDPAKAAVIEYARKLKQANKVKSGALDRIAKNNTSLDTIMGLVENDLRLPEILLTKPVDQRTAVDYEKALGGKLSGNAIKLIYMKHAQLAKGKDFEPEFPKLWAEYEKILTGKFSGSLDDRYELITASLLANGKFPKIVKAQKKAVKKAAEEGLTKEEAAKAVTKVVENEAKADELQKAVEERMAAAAAVAEAPAAPVGEKPKTGRPVGPMKATLNKTALMEERIILAGKALNPTDDDRFFIIASGMIDPAQRAKGLSWLSTVATKHAKATLNEKLAKFAAGLKTIEGRAEISDAVKKVPLVEEIVAETILTPGEIADAEAAIAERKIDETTLNEASMQELIVEETARELDEEDLPEINIKPDEKTLVSRFLSDLAKKIGVEITPQEAWVRYANMRPSERAKNLELAKQWKAKNFQLAARDIDPLTVHFVTGQPLPIREFATAWAREAGVPEKEIPATVEDFVRITQMFAAGEARFGKLSGTVDGMQFARASAGAFDFGMREVLNGQIQRPGKPPLGTKDGWMTELDFRNNGGDINGVLSKDEVNFYRELVPEAFADGKVHLQKLWDGLGKVGEQVKVVTYGQDGQATPEKAEFDRVVGELDIAGIHDYDGVFHRGNQIIRSDDASLPENVRKMMREFSGLKNAAKNSSNFGPRATSYYNHISPFDTKKFPVTRVDVVLPVKQLHHTSQDGLPIATTPSGEKIYAASFDKPLWQQDNLHENLPNTLGWAMVQIVPHPVTGEKVMVIAEAQGQWPQSKREQDAIRKTLKLSESQGFDKTDWEFVDGNGNRRLVQAKSEPEAWEKALRQIGGREVPNHPLLPIHQNLILKAVIKEAQKQGISKVAVSDGETAMMTEGHDKIQHAQITRTDENVAKAKQLLYSQKQTGVTYNGQAKRALEYIAEGSPDGRSVVEVDIDFAAHFGFTPELGRPSQEGGMRLAYDTTMPSIMKKLVGEGKVEDFGLHKNAIQGNPRENPMETRTFPTIDEAENFLSQQPGELNHGSIRRVDNGFEVNTPKIGSPVFRTPVGTPKTSATARVFDISNPSDRLNTLFAKGGTVYGAAFKDIAQAFFSTRAFQGQNKTKAMGYVLSHEMGHIAFGKAMRGEYGPETKRLFDEALAWVKTNDPAVLRDVEEIIRELYLPKEMRDLDGVRDVLGNTEPEEWMANAHAMMVTSAVNARKPIKALLILPKVFRDMVENTIRRVQEGLRHARLYWKLSGDKNKLNQVLRVKAMVDSVRSKFREAEWQTAQAAEFMDINPANLLNRMEEVQFARSPYPADTVRQKIGGLFNNATQGLGGFMATYKSFIEPGLKLLHAERSIKGQVAESLAPIFGHQGATGNIVVDKSMPWFKLANSKPLYELVKKINLEAQEAEQSVIVKNPDGTLSFNWLALTPESRATVKLYPVERQREMAQFLMQKEQSTRIIQKNNVQHETATAHAFVANLISKMKSFNQASTPEMKFKEAREEAGKLFAAVASGDISSLQEVVRKFAEPAEANKLVEIVQEKHNKLKDLEKFYAARPNFQSLRRFKPILQRYVDAKGEGKVLDFNTSTEAKAMKKELEAKGWKAQGDPILRDLNKEYKNEFTLDSKIVELLESKEGRLKDIVTSMDLDPVDREAILDESSFLADVMREVKSNDIYLPGAKRRISGGPEHLDMLEQHLTYTQAAHKVGHMKALGAEIKYFMNSPELRDQVREKQQFLDFYRQAKEPDPKFWRLMNKANAVWHIGFNLPGHLAELFQPIQTHIHEAVAQGHSMLTALRTTVAAEKSAAHALGKMVKSKLGYKDADAIWDHWDNKDEADMLKTNWPRNLQQPLQEVYQQVGVNQETLRAVVEDREMPSPSKVLTKAVNMYANTAMGVYSVFTQHNALVGLLTGYRLARKKGLSHADAVKQAELFELTVNNSGGRLERPTYFKKLGSAGYLVYALSSYVRGRFTDLARYYRHGFDKVNFPELNQADRRAARQAFATMISGQLAAAGILGFPFVGAGIALMEDLTGEELKGQGLAALNEMTDDPLLTQALSYGAVSSMAESLGIPADLHSRFALGGFLGINSYDGVSAASVLGPTASMINSMWNMGKTLVQEKDLGAAFRAGGPGGVKRLAEALSEDFQGQNPEANLPMAMAGFRSGKMFKQKEMERIVSRTNEAAQRDIQIAAKRVEESLQLGPEIAQKTLMREANQLISQDLEGRGRQLALKEMMQNLRQRIALTKVKEQMPSDIRGKATAQTAPRIEKIAQAVGYQPPQARNVEQEMIMRDIYAQLGAPRSPASLRNAQKRQAELLAEPNTFY